MVHPPGKAASPGTGAGAAPGQLRRVALSGLIGTAVEFYDFLVYGTVAALVFGDLFFPEADPAVGTVAAFGTFAAGYLARPLGGIVFGHFGDRLGRKSMMLLTMVLMGTGSFLIGLLPTYDTIGVWAPVLLVLLRVVQGIAIGGEWGGATLMVAEHAGERPRGLWTSFTQLGAPLGTVLSTGVVALVSTLPDDDFRAWGWRVPFLLSLVLLGAGLYVRLKVTESPLFASRSERRERAPMPMPLLDVLRAPRPVLLASAVGIGPFTAQALLTSFMISYAVDEGYSRQQVLIGVTVASCVALVVLPCANHLSDRLGRRPVVLAGALLSAATAFPVFALVDSHRPGQLILACVIGHGIAQSVMYGPLGALFSEMFPTRVRYTGASLGYQTATLLGAGLSPLIAGALLAAGHSSGSVAVLLTAGSAITALAVWRVTETSAQNLAVQGEAP
ncbi:MFS transporter [Streptomyces sp. KN37]|uniref:MFS transporter n=1 Tax=Streptomyces sp. KN37 TaxID=3090667 RepID=UPI002A74CA5B|nr:MFS transporter [Streptomyces sp. KN37]WPO69406.1 MFS transporter [Streptomyces sp. KN37]